MAFSHCVAALDYVPPWDRLIAQMKFHARPELARPLAACLVEAIEHAQGLGDATAPRPDWVLPIPLAPQRLRERGFNQAWELARHVARSLGLSAHAGMLLRWRDTAQQSGLSLAERASNLHQAFVVAPAQVAALRGRNLALVDDVCTSGATADAAAQALLAAGAASVQIWVVARTPPPQD